jgi:glycine hydroxymethyltransferase
MKCDKFATTLHFILLMLSRVLPRGAFYSVVPLFVGNQALTEFDPEIFALNELGVCHQIQSLELGESETFSSPSTLRAVATHFDKSFERSQVLSSRDQEILSELKTLCRQRALAAFGLDSTAWAVAVQPIPASIAVARALLPSGGRAIGLPQTEKWQSLNHVVDRRTLLFDAEALARNAKEFRPHLIVAGASGYPRNLDYSAFRKAADAAGAVLVADLAQTAALVSAGIAPSPFKHCDVVIATAQKSSRSDLVFYRKGKLAKQFETAFTEWGSVPQTAAVAVAMKEAVTPEFKLFQYTVVENMKRLAAYLTGHSLPLVTGGTDHQVAQVDLQQQGVDGDSAKWVLDCANITTTAHASSLTISSPALTERGLKERDFEQVGNFLLSGVRLAKDLRRRHPADTFKRAVARDVGVSALKNEVVAFARQFPLPGTPGKSI